MNGTMTKAPLGGEKTGKNPTDRGKIGTKRSLLTDGRGVPLGVAIAGANVHDKRLVRDTIQSIPVARPKPTRNARQNMCQDKGYDYPDVRELVTEFGYTAHIPLGEKSCQLRSLSPFRLRVGHVPRGRSFGIGS